MPRFVFALAVFALGLSAGQAPADLIDFTTKPQGQFVNLSYSNLTVTVESGTTSTINVGSQGLGVVGGLFDEFLNAADAVPEGLRFDFGPTGATNITFNLNGFFPFGDFSGGYPSLFTRVFAVDGTLLAEYYELDPSGPSTTLNNPVSLFTSFITGGPKTIGSVVITADFGGRDPGPEPASFAVADVSFSPAAVPEPATTAMLGLGVVGVAAVRRLHRRG